MKKILFAVMALLAVFLMVSCGDKPVNDTEATDVTKLPDYDTRFDNTVEDAAACYFSLLTEDGFGNYLLAFPEEFIKGYQNELEYDDATFKEAIDNATYTLHVTRDSKYMGYEFHIEYDYLSDTEITGEEKSALLKDLAAYCYMTESTIEKVVEYTYDVVTYGLDTETDEIFMEEQENKKLTMLYITGEGWYVSPTNFELP